MGLSHTPSYDRFDRSWERRRHRRYPLRTAATLAAAPVEEESPPWWVENLSRGGALLSGADIPELGSQLSLILHLPWFRPIKLDTQVIRTFKAQRAPQNQFSVAFQHLDDEQENRLEEAALAATHRDNQSAQPAAVVVTAKHRWTERLVEDLAHLGFRTVLAQTPLEALWWIQQRQQTVQAVIVDSQVAHQRLYPLLDYLRQFRQDLTHLMVDEGTLSPGALFGRIHYVLRPGWRIEDLEQALGVPEEPTR